MFSPPNSYNLLRVGITIVSLGSVMQILELKEGESELKAGIFIISHVKSSSVTHIFAPRIDGRYIRQSLEDH